MLKITFAVAVVAAVSLTACSSNNNNKKANGLTKVTVNTTGIAEDKALTIGERSEKLALAAEQLVTAQSFMYADEVVSAALLLDPKNVRAQLIKHLVAPAMLTKGILERVKPIALHNEKSKFEYNKAIKEILANPNSALKTFLFEGKQDIKTERDAQAYITQIQNSLDRLRLWFKANKNVEMTLHIPAEFSEETMRSQVRKCSAKRIKTGVFELVCDKTNILEVKLNQADLEGVQQIVAGVQIFANLANSYDLSGSIATADKFEGQDNPEAKLVVNELLKNKDFGILRSSHGLNNIISMGLDGVAGIRWAQAIQTELCREGEGNENRPGMLFEEGICIQQDSESIKSEDKNYQTFGDVMRAVEIALRGGNIVATFTGQLGEIETEVNAAAFLNNPITDVRRLTPLKWDKCDRVVGIADPFAGGVFVRGDVNAVLLLDKNNCYPHNLPKYK